MVHVYPEDGTHNTEGLACHCDPDIVWHDENGITLENGPLVIHCDLCDSFHDESWDCWWDVFMQPL